MKDSHKLFATGVSGLARTTAEDSTASILRSIAEDGGSQEMAPWPAQAILEVSASET